MNRDVCTKTSWGRGRHLDEPADRPGAIPYSMPRGAGASPTRAKGPAWRTKRNVVARLDRSGASRSSSFDGPPLGKPPKKKPGCGHTGGDNRKLAARREDGT